MKRQWARQLLTFGFVLATPLQLQIERPAQAKPVVIQTASASPVKDPRTTRLYRFLRRLHCPVQDLAEEFIHAADDNNLDWRLLPSISIIESSGGKAFKNNNILGWANGDHPFPTIRAGIHQVAFRLGKSDLYRNRSTEEKLRLYNPNEEYPGRVEEVMYRISPVIEISRADAFPFSKVEKPAQN